MAGQLSILRNTREVHSLRGGAQPSALSFKTGAGEQRQSGWRGIFFEVRTQSQRLRCSSIWQRSTITRLSGYMGPSTTSGTVGGAALRVCRLRERAGHLTSSRMVLRTGRTAEGRGSDPGQPTGLSSVRYPLAYAADGISRARHGAAARTRVVSATSHAASS